MEDHPETSGTHNHNNIGWSEELSDSFREASSTAVGFHTSAPGKITLFGEHAVVYGKTAVSGSIDLRTFASLYTSADQRIYLSIPELDVERTWLQRDLLKAVDRLKDYTTDDSQPPSLEHVLPVARRLAGQCEDSCGQGVQHLAVLAFWYILLGCAMRKSDMLAIKLTVRFQLPCCVGLGSSGAFCVVTAASLLTVAGIIPFPARRVYPDTATWDDKHLDVIRRWSAHAEGMIHGRGTSGLDAALCTYGRITGQYDDFGLAAFCRTYGGVATYKSGAKISPLHNLQTTKIILINTKIERNITRMTQTVKDRHRKFPEIVESIFASIDAVSSEAVRALTGELQLDRDTPRRGAGSRSSMGNDGAPSPCTLETGSRPQSRRRSSSAPEDEHHVLQDLCRVNNTLLIALGLGHPKVEQVSTMLARYGIHPKMTGAGGGGSLYAFLKPDTSTTVLEMITQEVSKIGFECFQTTLGCPGVYAHSGRPSLMTPKP